MEDEAYFDGGSYCLSALFHYSFRPEEEIHAVGFTDEELRFVLSMKRESDAYPGIIWDLPFD